MEFRLETYDEIGSTNDAIKQAISDGTAEGLAVIARRQTNGRGRQGRTWSSPEGGLYMSVLLRPEAADPATLSLVAGIAVLRALRKRCSVVALKWPNDIVVPPEDGAKLHDGNQSIATKATFPYRKICGILAESRGGAICIGLGINVHRPKEAFSTNMAQPAYLEELVESCPEPVELGREVLAELAEAYELWKTEGFAPFALECNESDVLIGSHVAAQDSDGKIVVEGTAVRIAEDGSMILQEPDGTLSPIRSGEVHLIH